MRICSTDNKQMLENGGKICYTIAGGDPLKIICKRFDDETIEKLLQIKWWDFCDEKLEQVIPLITSLEHEDSLKKLEVLAGQE